MHVWRRLPWLMILCLSLYFPSFALAESAHAHLTINAAAHPSQMVLAQDVTFYFQLQNSSEADAYDVAVLLPEANGQRAVGALPAGERTSVEFAYPVTDAELDEGMISFSVAHADVPDGELYYDDVTLPLTRVQEAPDVEFTRQISSRYVRPGDSLTVVYHLKNTGNVPLNAISLSDPLGGYAASLERLDVGEEKAFINRITPEGAVSSTPSVTFSSEISGQSYTKSLTEAAIAPADERLSAQLSVNRSEVAYGEAVTLTLTLRNDGNVSFSDVALTDSALGMLENQPLSLPSGGEPVVVTRNCIIKSDTTFQVHISGSTDAGSAFSMDTNPVDVSVLLGDGSARLSVSAEPSARALSAPGMVSFTITLTNRGQSDLTRVTLREAARGEVRVFDVIPAGEPTVREQMYDVSEDTTFQFIAEMTDADGVVRAVSSQPISVTIGETGSMPATTPPPSADVPGLHRLRIGTLSIYPAMLGGVLSLLALLVGALLISSRRRRQRKNASRAARDRRREKLASTNKFKPIRRQGGDGSGKRKK